MDGKNRVDIRRTCAHVLCVSGLRHGRGCAHGLGLRGRVRCGRVRYGRVL